MPQVHAVIHTGGVTMAGQLLQQIVEAGIRRITVVLGPQGSSVRARLLRLMTMLPPLELEFFDELEAPGDVGVLAEIDTGHDEVLLCFADPAAELDLSRLMAIHRERRYDVTLASHYEHHQLAPGELRVDGDTVHGYEERPRKDFLICSGIAMLDARAMAVARALPRTYGVAELLRALLEGDCRVTHWLHGTRWIVNEDAERAVHEYAEPIIRRQAG
jgi:NDP-sugar pyrophosphorylase family protein